MDPHTPNQLPSFDLPQPVAEQGNNPDAPLPKVAEVPVSTEGGSAEQPSSGGGPQPLPSAQNDPIGSVPLPPLPAGTPASTTPVSATPPLAEDVDLIEKAWVQKAKEIVQKTKDDPRTQNKEINKIKADYIKKRYNRDVKVSEE